MTHVIASQTATLKATTASAMFLRVVLIIVISARVPMVSSKTLAHAYAGIASAPVALECFVPSRKTDAARTRLAQIPMDMSQTAPDAYAGLSNARVLSQLECFA